MAKTMTTQEVADALGLTRAGVFNRARIMGVSPVDSGRGHTLATWRASDLSRFGPPRACLARNEAGRPRKGAK